MGNKQIPIYGDGTNVRDWLFVEDHIDALLCVGGKGVNGETYCIGGNCEKTNNDLIHIVCELLNEIHPHKKSYLDLIEYVPDRPGHDFRYSLYTSKIKKDFNWKPIESFSSGLVKTVQWYLDNQIWWEDIQKRSYKQERLGRIRK